MSLAALDADNQRWLGGWGACEAVSSVLKSHGWTNADIAEAACWAVSNLASNSVENQAKLGTAGACEAVVEALSVHGESDVHVAEAGCWAVNNLIMSSIVDNQRRILEAGACVAVVTVLALHAMDSDSVAEAVRTYIETQLCYRQYSCCLRITLDIIYDLFYDFNFYARNRLVGLFAILLTADLTCMPYFVRLVCARSLLPP
jgi:hypothetical protein